MAGLVALVEGTGMRLINKRPQSSLIVGSARWILRIRQRCAAARVRNGDRMTDVIRIADAKDHIDASCCAGRDIGDYAVPDSVIRSDKPKPFR